MNRGWMLVFMTTLLSTRGCYLEEGWVDEPIGGAKWNADLHVGELFGDGTQGWATALGMSEVHAAILAWHNINADLSPETAASFGHLDFHFNTASASVADIGSDRDTRVVRFREYYGYALSEWPYSQVEALGYLGIALHAYQDVYAHGNVQSIAEHDSFRGYFNVKAIDDVRYDIDWNTREIFYAGPFGKSRRYYLTKEKTEEILSRFMSDVSYFGPRAGSILSCPGNQYCSGGWGWLRPDEGGCGSAAALWKGDGCSCTC